MSGITNILLYFPVRYCEGVINLDIYTHIKNRCIILTGSAIISYVTYSTFISCIVKIMYVVNARSIVYFSWQSVPLVLFVPTAIYFIILFMSAFFSKNLAPYRILQRGMNIALGYGGAAIVLGVIISIIVPFYLLSNGYVYCYGGGPFSSVFYTKNESICEQMNIVWDSEGSKAIQKLNDKLDSMTFSGKN